MKLISLASSWQAWGAARNLGTRKLDTFLLISTYAAAVYTYSLNGSFLSRLLQIGLFRLKRQHIMNRAQSHHSLSVVEKSKSLLLHRSVSKTSTSNTRGQGRLQQVSPITCIYVTNCETLCASICSQLLISSQIDFEAKCPNLHPHTRWTTGYFVACG